MNLRCVCPNLKVKKSRYWLKTGFQSYEIFFKDTRMTAFLHEWLVLIRQVIF